MPRYRLSSAVGRDSCRNREPAPVDGFLTRRRTAPPPFGSYFFRSVPSTKRTRHACRFGGRSQPPSQRRPNTIARCCDCSARRRRAQRRLTRSTRRAPMPYRLCVLKPPPRFARSTATARSRLGTPEEHDSAPSLSCTTAFRNRSTTWATCRLHALAARSSVIRTPSVRYSRSKYCIAESPQLPLRSAASPPVSITTGWSPMLELLAASNFGLACFRRHRGRRASSDAASFAVSEQVLAQHPTACPIADVSRGSPVTDELAHADHASPIPSCGGARWHLLGDVRCRRNRPDSSSAPLAHRVPSAPARGGFLQERFVERDVDESGPATSSVACR